MDRATLLTALAPVDDLEEILIPKAANTSEFVPKDDGLYWQVVGGEEYKVGRDAAGQAMRHVPGLSAAAVKEWPVSLLLEPLNWWYEHGDGEVRALVNGQAVVSFTKQAVAGIHSPTRMLEAMETALEVKGVDLSTLWFDKVRVGLDRVSFAAVTSEDATEIKEGDIFQSGIAAFGSPTGEAYTEVSPYLLRLLCTNGMVSPVAMERYSYRGAGGDGGSLYDWTREMTLQAWDALDGELEAVRQLTQIELDGHVQTVLADLFERHHVPAGLRQSVLEAAVEENDGTMFGIAQAFNRVANDEEDVRRLRHLMMVTGDIAHQTERCKECLRALS